MTKNEIEAATEAVLRGIQKHLIDPGWVNAPLVRDAAEKIALDVIEAAGDARGQALVRSYRRDQARAGSRPP